MKLSLILGVLKGFDPLLNLVLDSATEYLRDSGKIDQNFINLFRF